jgi:histidinol-phosphate aminotransferase
LVAEYIEKLVPYVPGKPVEEVERELGIVGAVKLASNENPLGPSPRALEAARAASAQVNRYPDGGGYLLRGRLAEQLGVAPEQIVLGSGSSEIVDVLVRTFCRPGSDLRCDVDALAAAVSEKTKLIFLPNPNNPTGAYVTRDELERLLTKLPQGVMLVMDEAYFEYARMLPDYPVGEDYRAARRLLVTLRTFSKAYGLAGMRVGYGIADREVIDYLNRVRLVFNVPSVAQEAARAALDDEEHVLRSVRVNDAGRAQLTEGLTKLGFRVYPSAANFVLVDVGRDGESAFQALLRQGVIVRPLRPAGLMQHVRVSIGTAAENAKALAAFGEIA